MRGHWPFTSRRQRQLTPPPKHPNGRVRADRLKTRSGLRVAVRLDAVAIGVLEEGRVIIRPVVRAWAGLPVVAATMLEPASVEAIDARLRWRRKANMQSGVGGVG